MAYAWLRTAPAISVWPVSEVQAALPNLLCLLLHSPHHLSITRLPSPQLNCRTMLSVLATALFASASVGAVPCVQFDADWSLYAFGGNEDVKLGASDSWGCKSRAVSRLSAAAKASVDRAALLTRTQREGEQGS